jgi:hypothetical protein
MSIPATPSDYRWKARNCRSLAKTSAERALAKYLVFLAREYDAAAATMEAKEQAERVVGSSGQPGWVQRSSRRIPSHRYS